MFVVLITEATAECFCCGTAAHRARRDRSLRLLYWIGVWNMTRRCLITHLLFGTSVLLNSPPARWWLTLLAKTRQKTTTCFKVHSCSKLPLNAAQLLGSVRPVRQSVITESHYLDVRRVTEIFKKRTTVLAEKIFTALQCCQLSSAELLLHCTLWNNFISFFLTLGLWWEWWQKSYLIW